MLLQENKVGYQTKAKRTISAPSLPFAKAMAYCHPHTYSLGAGEEGHWGSYLLIALLGATY